MYEFLDEPELDTRIRGSVSTLLASLDVLPTYTQGKSSNRYDLTTYDAARMATLESILRTRHSDRLPAK